MSEPTELPYPNPIRRCLKLSDGRTLAYNNFYEEATSKNLHPVLYFHGFPSSGLEGSFCAAQVHEAGGQLFAVDRPGFGFSDPYPKELDNGANARMDSFCQSIWEMIEHLQWKKFSIIGVSGGGIFTLHMLESYLRRRSEDHAAAKLEAISIVAGVYAPAGLDGMMSSNQSLVRAVDANRTWMLGTIFLVPGLLFKLLPSSAMLKMMPTSEMPKCDVDVMKDPVVGKQLCRVMVDASRQAPCWTAQLEAMVCLCSTANQRMEESLKSFFSESTNKKPSNNDNLLPRVSLFHGSDDVNVPVSHSLYVHERLLQKRSELHLYEGHGHASIAFATLRDTFARAAMP